jgi:transposase InsO family protein
VNEIRLVHNNIDDSHGSPCLINELAKCGFCTNRKRLERLVAEYGLCVTNSRSIRATIADLGAPRIPDLVMRDFSVGEPGLPTCGDITYILTSEGWLYLADELDLVSRRVFSYSLDDNIRIELVANAPTMAILTRGGDLKGLIFHHDRGSQFMSGDIRIIFGHCKIVHSAGQTGLCPYNAAANNSLATLKREYVYLFRLESRARVRRATAGRKNQYIAPRQHSSINNMSPNEWVKFSRQQIQAE